MNRKTIKIMRVAVIIAVALVLCAVVGLLASASAASTPEDIAIIETRSYKHYSISPEGYSIDGRYTVPHTGAYLLYGEANEDVEFTSENGESVTYDVILHNWNAVAQDWYGLIGVEKGVTLNITVLGSNTVKGYNHPGIKLNGSDEEGVDPVVNITVAENSYLTLGSQAGEENENYGCVGESVVVNLSEGVNSNVDMSSESWRGERSITFSRGDSTGHKQSFTYIDDETCRHSCSDCDYLTMDVWHDHVYTELAEDDVNYAAKHKHDCVQCGHEFGTIDHSIKYSVTEDKHTAWCNECDYSEPAAEHTRGDVGCTVCQTDYIASFTEGEQVSFYLTVQGLAAGINGKSGTVRLLRDVVEIFGESISVPGGELVIDLAGFKLEGVRIVLESGAKASIIDSSKNKAGEYAGSEYGSSTVSGTLLLDGITVTGGGFYAMDGGSLVINNTVVKSGGAITHEGNSKIEITDVVYEGELSIITNRAILRQIMISGSAFGKIKVGSSGSEYISVNMLIGEGYAYIGENGILDGSKNEISGVIAISKHSEHNEDMIQHDAEQHWMGCTCGYYSDTVVGEEHTIDESLACPTCGVGIAASVNDGSGEKYFADIDAAFEYADTIDSSTVRLYSDSAIMSDATIRTNVILDLNGCTMKTSPSRIYIYGSLTVTDSSIEKTGRLVTDGNDGLSYLINVCGGGSLTVNDGELFGLIYTALYYGESASVEINGGRFTGARKFRITNGATVVINGGWFENEEGTFTLWSSSGYNLTVNGGVFVNSRLFYELSDSFLSPEELLGTDGECELVFTDELGGELQITNVSAYYEGVMVVAHKGAVSVKKQDGHALSCPTCHKETELIEHHSFKYAALTDDNTKHRVTCGVCEYELEPQEHTGGSATCQARAICEACSTEYGSLAEHSAEDTWITNETHHYHLCIYWTEGGTCQEQLDLAEHTDSDTNGRCDICEYQMETASGDPDNTPEPPTVDSDGLGTGAIVGIVVGSVAAAGIGGFALLWFVIKKKSWSDLVGIFKR